MADRRRVLVTRASLGTLGPALRAHQLVPVHLPLMALVPLKEPPPRLPTSTAAIVTSAAVVQLAPDAVRWLMGRTVVAVGPATAAALRQSGVENVVVAEGSGASALQQLSPRRPVCFVGALRPAPAMAAAIASGHVYHWPVYDRVEPPHLVAQATQLPPLELVTLASPSAAWTWARVAPHPRVPVVVVGPTTEAAARAAGLPLAGTAPEPSMEALAATAARWISDRSRG